MTTTDAYPSELQDLITTTFSRADLADLCLRLGVPFDSLPDAGLAAQARELILLLARQERLPALLAALQAVRPNVAWPPVPPGYRPPAAAAPPAPAAAPSAPAGGGSSFTLGSVKADNLIVGNHANMTINQGPRYDLSGDFRGALLNIESTLRDTRQAIENLPAPDDARAALIRLVGRLDRALQTTPPDRAPQAAEVADITKELVKAAGAARPRPAVLRGLGDELRQAAAALADAVPAAPDIADQLASAVVDLTA